MGVLEDERLLNGRAVQVMVAVDRDGNNLFSGTPIISPNNKKWTVNSQLAENREYANNNVQVVHIVDKDGNSIQ